LFSDKCLSTNGQKRGITHSAIKALNEDAINAILLHPFEVQIYHAGTGVVVEFGSCSIRIRELSIEKTLSWISTCIREEVKDG
jgi:hypothetical protein